MFSFHPSWIGSLSWLHIASHIKSKLLFPILDQPSPACLTIQPILDPSLHLHTLFNQDCLLALLALAMLIPNSGAFFPPLFPKESCLFSPPKNNLPTYESVAWAYFFMNFSSLPIHTDLSLVKMLL